MNLDVKQNENKNWILLIVLIILLFVISNKLHYVRAEPVPNCVVCTQSVPECGPDEEIVLQTCVHCAFCRPNGNVNPNCEVPCGKRCCKADRICVTIDMCKGKPNCSKPIIRKCKKPSSIN